MTYEESLQFTGTLWKDLDDKKKIEVLQSIEDHMALESNRIPAHIEGKFLHTGSDGIVLGSFDRSSGCIYINSSQFDSESMYGKDSSYLIKACLHEGRHSYQNQVLSGEVMHDDTAETALWRKNLEEGNYIKFSENPRRYYDQPVEKDAREFSEQRYEKLLTERINVSVTTKDDYNQAKAIFEEQINSDLYDGEKLSADYRQNMEALDIQNHNARIENEIRHC